MDSPVSTWFTAVLFLMFTLTFFLLNVLLVTTSVVGVGVGDGVGHAFAGELCRAVGFGAMHHSPDGQVKVFVAGSKFAIA